MSDPIWRLHLGDGPLVAAAIHDGHELRPEVGELMAVPEPDRLREEDPFTGRWTAIAPTRVIATRSRFEVDLNRPREKAVYRKPEDAWGLKVWRTVPGDGLVNRSLQEYDAFYAAMQRLFAELTHEYGHFVVMDLHTYNHRRGGPGAPAADDQGNPQVNVGTRTMDRNRWGPVVDSFMEALRCYDFPGGRLDVRENVKFGGGHFVRWLHEAFPASGCGLAIEFKKFFMDEWTGAEDSDLVLAIFDALLRTMQGVLEQLRRL
jgi:hypothetical protein